MSPVAPPVAAPRRRYWPLFLVLGLVLALAAAWTGLWFYVAAQAKAEMDTWRAREREAGRQQDCASVSVGGYPFRIEVRCVGASFELAGTPTVTLRLPSLLAAVQVYDPRLLISEFAAPLDISQRRGGTNYVVNWDVGRASVRGVPSQPERGSLVLDALSVRDTGTVGNDFAFKARHLELHGRQAPGSRADNPAIETVLELKDATAAQLHSVTARPFDADVTSILRGIKEPSQRPWPEQLREWQSRNGEIEITKARVQQDNIIAEGVGTLRLTQRGGLDGNLQVTIVGIETILKMFNLERLMSEGQVGATLDALDRLIPGLGGIARQSAAPGITAALGKRTVLDGKPAMSLALRFADGAVFVGPFQVGVVPPLF
jgi:hypothetical protein